MAECRAGNKEALNLFYVRFAPRMLSVIRRYVADNNDARDILHDGFIVAFTRLESLRDYNRVDYWLATIMKNLSLQFLQMQDVTKMLHEIPEVEDTPELDEIIDMDILESLIRKLPPGYQKVFRLAVLENKSHKEIAGLLGIAPNSSSSQLFHAKLLMRKLITDYRKQAGILSLLLFSLVAGLYCLWSDDALTSEENVSHILIADNRMLLNSESHERESDSACEERKKSACRQLQQQSAAEKKVAASEGGNEQAALDDNTEYPEPQVEQNEESAEKDCLAEAKDEGQTTAHGKDSDTFAYEETVETPYEYGEIPVVSVASGWSVGAVLSTGVANSKAYDSFRNEAIIPPNNSGNSVGGIDGEESHGGKFHRRPSRSGVWYSDAAHHNHMPVTFAIAASKSFTNVISAETGLTYSYLHSEFDYLDNVVIHCHWHYIGIPLKLKFNTFSTGKISFYGSLGGAVDIPVYSNAVEKGDKYGNNLNTGRFSSSVVWSVSASCGMSYKMTDKASLFVEPTVQYHFRHNYNVPNIWTDNPFGFTLPIGVRLNF